MDRLIQLQRGRPRLKPPTIAEEEETEDEDVADFYQYVPRRKGDFPPVAYEPPDDAPQSTRYDIVDREFEDDVPVYIVRPRTDLKESDLTVVASVESEDTEGGASDGQVLKGDLSRVAARTRSSSSRQTPNSRASESIQHLLYDPDDPAILRVDLFDIYDYVTPKELERFETFRFENPKPEDYPVTVSLSDTSSVVARDERTVHRQEVKAATPLAKQKKKPGRPPAKKSRLGPMVVIESPRATSISSSNAMAMSSREESEEMEEELPREGRAFGQEPILQSIEDSEDDELDILDMSTSLRGTGGSLGQSITPKGKPKATPVTVRRTTRSVSRLETPSSAEMQLVNEARQPLTVVKRRGRPPQTPSDPDRLQPMPASTSKMPYMNGNNATGSSAATSRSTSKSQTQTTIDSYMKAMSTVKKAKEPVAQPKSQSQQPLRKRTPQPAKTNGSHSRQEIKKSAVPKGKQPATRVEPVFEPTPPAEDGDNADVYEIDHIVLHDDSRGERFYLVRWIGWPLEDATWLSEGELENAQDVLQEYLQTLVDKMVD